MGRPHSLRAALLLATTAAVACSSTSEPASAGLDGSLPDAGRTSSLHDARVDGTRLDAHVAPPPAHDGSSSHPPDARISDAGTHDASKDASVTDASTSPLTTLITVHYPTTAGHVITLRGSSAPLNWSAGSPLVAGVLGDSGVDNVWTMSLALTAPIQVKPLYDDTTWAIGPNWVITPGVNVDIWPHFFTNNGTITEIDNWYSHALNNSRTIWVYLPPSAAENPDERFPVAYFQDGQNDFYDDLSYSGTAWDLQGAMDDGAADGTIHEAIVIGIANDGDGRTWEYTPTPENVDGGMDGGGAPLYLTFVATELKPQMDLQFPTEPDRAHTALCGSSLGGLVSLYGGLTRNDVFGLIGALSPSTWWDDEWILGQVVASVGAPGQPIRIYLDSGNAGVFAQPDPWPAQANYDDYTQTAVLAQAYGETGVPLDYLVQDGGQHNETYWKERVPGTLAYLFGPR